MGIFNLYSYGSSSLAGESGITTEFSYNKFLYLALPKFDMDVFLSTNSKDVISGSHPNDGLLQIVINSDIRY